MASPEFLATKEQLIWLLANASVDHDNTISDGKSVVTDEFNKEFDTQHQATEIWQWHSVVGWAEKLGMDRREALAVNRRYWYNSDLINRAKPKPGAIEFLSGANKLGRLIINSSRSYDQLGSTREWYREYAPFIKPEQIVVGLPDIVKAEDILSQALSKVWVARLFKSRAHVEDTVFHGQMVLDYTDAFLFLLSDDSSLDGRYHDRLMRMGGVDGRLPDLTFLNKRLNF